MSGPLFTIKLRGEDGIYHNRDALLHVGLYTETPQLVATGWRSHHVPHSRIPRFRYCMRIRSHTVDGLPAVCCIVGICHVPWSMSPLRLLRSGLHIQL